MVTRGRNITPRTKAFINWWKEKCSAMLDSSPFGRKKIAREVEVLYGDMNSRYEKIHGPNGLCVVVVDVSNAMAELRLKAEYGDYLAYTCSALKGDNFNDMIWKIQKVDWQVVGSQILEEEKMITERKEWPRASSDPKSCKQAWMHIHFD